MTKNKAIRKFWISKEQLADESGEQVYFDDTLFIQATPLLEGLRAVRDELTSNHDNYDAIVKLDALIKEIEGE